MIDAKWTIRSLICDAFRSHNLKRSPDRALQVTFRLVGNVNLEMLLWSPMNYVGVFTRGRSWAYHDSCWVEGVERVLDHYWDRIEGPRGLEVVPVDVATQNNLRLILKENQ